MFFEAASVETADFDGLREHGALAGPQVTGKSSDALYDLDGAHINEDATVVIINPEKASPPKKISKIINHPVLARLQVPEISPDALYAWDNDLIDEVATGIINLEMEGRHERIQEIVNYSFDRGGQEGKALMLEVLKQPAVILRPALVSLIKTAYDARVKEQDSVPDRVQQLEFRIQELREDNERKDRLLRERDEVIEQQRGEIEQLKKHTRESVNHFFARVVDLGQPKYNLPAEIPWEKKWYARAYPLDWSPEQKASAYLENNWMFFPVTQRFFHCTPGGHGFYKYLQRNELLHLLPATLVKVD